VQEFTYTSAAARVIFGAGSLQHLEREVELLGAQRALVLCTPEQTAIAQQVAERLGARAVGVFAGAAMHVPIETARAARAEAARLGADCAVAVGGGSTIGLGKAIALEEPAGRFPILAIPTTYAGSEMTPIYGITEAGVKKTGKDLRVLPRTVIYDAQLTLTLPVALSMSSGLNALAHSAEGLYARDGNPIMALLAEEGIRALAQALPQVKADPADIAARELAQYGAWLCGTVLGNVGMALHHKLCHTLGGSFNLPHAETHAVILPHAIAYNAAAVPQPVRAKVSPPTASANRSAEAPRQPVAVRRSRPPDRADRPSAASSRSVLPGTPPSRRPGSPCCRRHGPTVSRSPPWQS
jgi:alcohol dehydrogenase class IV